MAKKNMVLILLVILIGIIPLVINKGAEYGGADGEAEAFITEIDPDYKPWFSSIWEPPSGEIESMLFALQAALGAGFVFFFFGYYMGKRKGDQAGKPDGQNRR
jgi:cobalt/nickel transport protein